MRISQRLISMAVLVALSTALAGCGSTSGFDPTDLLDFLDQKKKLPGDRKPVFPEGVPGLEQGVPKNLYKGAVEGQQAEQATPAAAPVEPEPKAKPKRARAKRTSAPAAAPAPDGEAATEEDGGANAAPPAPKPMKQSRRRVTTPPAEQPAADTTAPAAAPQSSSPSAFPAPMPSGTFQR